MHIACEFIIILFVQDSHFPPLPQVGQLQRVRIRSRMSLPALSLEQFPVRKTAGLFSWGLYRDNGQVEIGGGQAGKQPGSE